MAEKTSKRKKSPYREPAPAPAEPEVDVEVAASKWMASALPLVTAIGALIVGSTMSAAPAILVLVGGALLGAVLLFWSSVRSLTGDAPLPGDLAAASISASVSEAQERKKRALRALKDLENERAVGKLEEEDYAILSAQYRTEAKEAMRDLDAEISPVRARAETLANEHIAKLGILEETTKESPVEEEDGAEDDEEEDEEEVAEGEEDDAEQSSEDREEPAENRVCEECGTTNDEDATFCKKCGEKLDAA